MESTQVDNQIEKGMYSGLAGAITIGYEDLSESNFTISGYLKRKMKGE